MKTVWVVSLLGLMGCDLTVQVGARTDGGEPDGGGESRCLPGLTKGDWFLIKQSVHGVLQDALQVTEESAKRQGGRETFWGALSVPGGRSPWQDQLGFSDWLDPPFCEKAIQCKQPHGPMTGIRFCMKTSCGASREVIVSTAVTSPQLMTTDSNHTLSYAVDVEPPVRTDAGLAYLSPRDPDVRTIEYPLNPSAQWHLQYSTTGGVALTASLAYALTATDGSSRVLDLKNTAAISVETYMPGAVPAVVTGTMSMPNVTGGALEIEWHLDATNQIVGQVKQASAAVGSFRIEIPTSFNVAFAGWTSACD
ncbi:MAG: hypothetical protein H6Q89_3322 [Myxococcaceae bacterium]|nr:hypothetical protein [Myxococcaceae bacterium]